MSLSGETREVLDRIGRRGGDVAGSLTGKRDAPKDVLYQVCKRLFDVVASALLIVLLSPAFLYISYLIRRQDGGPVFFRQHRHGLNGSTFRIFKFRTMTAEASAGGFVQCRQGDARVTPLGHLLRRTSLDELPQLFNVFRGEMSLVGPRPHAVAHDLEFCDILDHYWQRYRVLPGMTGLAQVRGSRGVTLDENAMAERLSSDLEYVQRASLWLDLTILFDTVGVVVRGENAV
jgi:lipopolysaccharide/colanic/teichoic acid biosynthesis glycosyltransferase